MKRKPKLIEEAKEDFDDDMMSLTGFSSYEDYLDFMGDDLPSEDFDDDEDDY